MDGMKIRIDREGMIVKSMDVSLEVQNLNFEVACEEVLDHVGHMMVHGEGLKHNGPNMDKLRPTWTRLSHMDCGLNEAKKSGTNTTLGKKSLLHESEQDHAEGVEVKPVKHGKVQNVSQDSKVVGVLDHPC